MSSISFGGYGGRRPGIANTFDLHDAVKAYDAAAQQQQQYQYQLQQNPQTGQWQYVPFPTYSAPIPGAYAETTTSGSGSGNQSLTQMVDSLFSQLCGGDTTTATPPAAPQTTQTAAPELNPTTGAGVGDTRGTTPGVGTNPPATTDTSSSGGDESGDPATIMAQYQQQFGNDYSLPLPPSGNFARAYVGRKHNPYGFTGAMAFRARTGIGPARVYGYAASDECSAKYHGKCDSECSSGPSSSCKACQAACGGGGGGGSGSSDSSSKNGNKDSSAAAASDSGDSSSSSSSSGDSGGDSGGGDSSSSTPPADTTTATTPAAPAAPAAPETPAPAAPTSTHLPWVCDNKENFKVALLLVGLMLIMSLAH